MYDTEAVRRANPIADVVMQSGIPVRRLGQRLIAACPFHREQRPSLTVYPATGSYFCFGCGAGGDVIDFVARLNGLPFMEAVEQLGAEDRPPTVRPLDRQPSVQPDTAVIEAAVAFYEDGLWASPKALDYLADRGIEETTASLYRLGFGIPGLAEELRRQGFGLGSARAVGLLSGRRDPMVGRIVMPELVLGHAVWLTGRVIGGSAHRYVNLRLPTPLLGLSRVQAGWVVVLEGPFDWLTAVQWGLPAVALLGTRVSPTVCSALERFSRVYIALDNDQAGMEAADKLLSALGERASAVHLPPGIHDLNELGRLPDGRTVFLNCLGTAKEDKPWTKHEKQTLLPAA